jgi:hypothetical protein
VIRIQVEVHELVSISVNQMRGKDVKRFFDFQNKMLRIMISGSCTFLPQVKISEITPNITIPSGYIHGICQVIGAGPYQQAGAVHALSFIR